MEASILRRSEQSLATRRPADRTVNWGLTAARVGSGRVVARSALLVLACLTCVGASESVPGLCVCAWLRPGARGERVAFALERPDAPRGILVVDTQGKVLAGTTATSESSYDYPVGWLPQAASLAFLRFNRGAKGQVGSGSGGLLGILDVSTNRVSWVSLESERAKDAYVTETGGFVCSMASDQGTGRNGDLYRVEREGQRWSWQPLAAGDATRSWRGCLWARATSSGFKAIAEAEREGAVTTEREIWALAEDRGRDAAATMLWILPPGAYSAAVSPDGRRMAYLLWEEASDTTKVYIVSTEKGSTANRVVTVEGEVFCAVFAPDGARLLLYTPGLAPPVPDLRQFLSVVDLARSSVSDLLPAIVGASLAERSVYSAEWLDSSQLVIGTQGGTLCTLDITTRTLRKLWACSEG